MVPLFLRSTELKLIRVAATNAFLLRGRWHEVTDEVFKIVNQYVCHKPVGAGSRLPTRSNRKTIATGNLRSRHPVSVPFCEKGGMTAHMTDFSHKKNRNGVKSIPMWSC